MNFSLIEVFIIATTITLWVTAWRRESTTLGILGFVIFFVYSLILIEDTEWRKEERKVAEVKRKQEATPHVIRQTADGCKVYAWKGGEMWHYFTRCSPLDTVTTERHYTVPCGTKNKDRCDKNEITVTEPQK